MAATSMVGKWSYETFQGNNKGQTSKKLTALAQGLLPEDLERVASPKAKGYHETSRSSLRLPAGQGRFPKTPLYSENKI